MHYVYNKYRIEAVYINTSVMCWAPIKDMEPVWFIVSVNWGISCGLKKSLLLFLVAILKKTGKKFRNLKDLFHLYMAIKILWSFLHGIKFDFNSTKGHICKWLYSSYRVAVRAPQGCHSQYKDQNCLSIRTISRRTSQPWVLWMVKLFSRRMEFTQFKCHLLHLEVSLQIHCACVVEFGEMGNHMGL